MYMLDYQQFMFMYIQIFENVLFLKMRSEKKYLEELFLYCIYLLYLHSGLDKILKH